MSTLSLMLYGEGPTDSHFLPIVIQPKRAALVELNPDPKVTFNNVVAKAESERRRKISRYDLYETLAQEIRLERLNQVPAYACFVKDLVEMLIELHILPERLDNYPNY
jgi:hypothetical protein